MTRFDLESAELDLLHLDESQSSPPKPDQVGHKRVGEEAEKRSHDWTAPLDFLSLFGLRKPE